MKLLIVVDMLKDFINPNGALFCGPAGEAIIPFVVDEVSEHRANGDPIIFLADNHDENDKEFDRFPKHCVAGTEGAELISVLNFSDEDGGKFIMRKTRYSGFYNTELDFHLKRLNPEAVTVVGVCTSICVMDTVAGLANRDQANIIVPKKCVADFDQEMHTMALKRMEALYGANVI